jgi:alpha-ketoglutarate-dependent taurine dioxygenase
MTSLTESLHVIEASGDEARTWVAAHWDPLRQAVTERGAVVVSGLGLDRPDTAVHLFQSLPVTLLTDREPFAPRTKHGEGVYSSLKWPSDQPMCMHHELSYALEFPGLIVLACRTAAATGGATGIADAASVLAALPADLVDRFERTGWLLERSYNGEVGVSTTDAFGTADRVAITAYCRANGIDFDWAQDGTLRTRQRRPAVVRHPVTGARCWFNQIAFLNEWTMAPEVREYLVDVYGPERLPFTTRFGDGSPISGDIVATINDVYDAYTVSRPWRSGDLMLIDNVRMAHSTEPHSGARDIVVGMAEPVQLADCVPDPVAWLSLQH